MRFSGKWGINERGRKESNWKFVKKCKKFDESVEIKGVSVGEEYRILETVCKALDLVEKLQKENEELKNDYENLNNSVVVKNHCIKNSIPVQKVKDKIRKNEEIIDISNDGDLIHELLQKNKVYEELLESEK